jgi:hypothetical protein
MMPKDEFDIRFENNPDFFESGVSRAYTGGMMNKKNKRLKELEEELGINTKPTRPAPETGSPYPTPPKKGPASKGMKQGGFLLTPQQKMQSQNAQKQIRNIEQRKLQRDVEQMQMDRNPPQMKEGGDIDARVEEELKKETPNAYPMMKGLSPITHLRRYLKKRELLSKKEKGIGLYDSPKTESKSGFGKVFKEARKKGEGTKFKYKEKDYSAVTKEDVSKSGKSSLKDYLDSPSKMKSGGSVMVKTKLGRNKPTRLC